MKSPSLKNDLENIRKHYDTLARKHGNSPSAAQWSSEETQDQRLRTLAQIGISQTASVLDFGCGTGRLLDVLTNEFGFSGHYTGYDLSPELLAIGRALHPGAVFVERDIFADGVGGAFDFACISGVFNNRISDNRGFIEKTLAALFPNVRRGLAFNALSCYVDYKDSGLYYADPEHLFRFCKEHLSPAVTLRHDYEVKKSVLPFEFTIYIYKCDHKPREKSAI